MNREGFNKLDIKGQVNHFNNELKQENNNFNAICRGLGISKNTILNRFKTNGFEPLRAGQKIIAFSQLVEKSEDKDILPSGITTLTEQNCSVKIENLTAENSAVKNPILDSEKLLVKNKCNVSDPKDINLILRADSSNGWVENICKLLSDEEKRIDIKKRMFNLLGESYSWKNIAKKLVE